jgi:hypothetical protein
LQVLEKQGGRFETSAYEWRLREPIADLLARLGAAQSTPHTSKLDTEQPQ